MSRRLFRLHLALSPLTLLFFSHSPSAETEILLLPNPQATSAGSRPNFAAIQSILKQRRLRTNVVLLQRSEARFKVSYDGL